MYGWMDVCMYGHTDVCMYGWMDVCMYGWMDGWIDRYCRRNGVSAKVQQSKPQPIELKV